MMYRIWDKMKDKEEILKQATDYLNDMEEL